MLWLGVTSVVISIFLYGWNPVLNGVAIGLFWGGLLLIYKSRKESNVP